VKKGEAKIEFFSNLKYLQNEYNNGLVVAKFLYKKAIHEKKFKMGYGQFNKYFNDVFGVKKNQNEKLVIDTPIEKKTKMWKIQDLLKQVLTPKRKKFLVLYMENKFKMMIFYENTFSFYWFKVWQKIIKP